MKATCYDPNISDQRKSVLGGADRFVAEFEPGLKK